MDLISIKSKTHKRVGRGLSAGQGKTAGRGTKGQKSRSGFNIPRKFEGGQTPLSMRLSKMPGFKSKKPKAEVIGLDTISAKFKSGGTVTIKALAEMGLVDGKSPVKILGNGELTISVTIDKAIKVSKSALELIEKAKKPAAEKLEKVEAKAETKTDKPKKTVAPKTKKESTK